MLELTNTGITTTHPVTGEAIEWHTYANLTDLPSTRYHYAELARQRIRAVLTPEELRSRLSEMLEMMNAGKGADFAWAVRELMNRMEHFGYEDSYIELAMVWTVCPALGEKPEEWTPVLNKVKAQMLKDNDEARFFFIHMAASLIYDLSSISVKAFPLLLAEQNGEWLSKMAKMDSLFSEVRQSLSTIGHES